MISCKQCKHTKNKESSECIHPKITPEFMDTYNWNPKLLAKKCRYFDKDKERESMLTASCMNCGKEMTTNEEWFYVEIADMQKPVCSLECKEEVEQKIDMNKIDIKNIQSIDDLFE